MGKNLIQQARGKGGPRYRAPSFRYTAEVKYEEGVSSGKIIDFVKSQGHSAPLVKLQYDNGNEGYLIAANGLKVGDTVSLEAGSEANDGNSLLLKNIPLGSSVFNIEGIPGDGGKFVRSGGTYAKITAKTENRITIMLPSKKEKDFDPNCRAIIGTIAGAGRKEKPFLKAGTRFHYMRARNKMYPRVSGQSMNAVDHPYGTSRSSKKGRPSIARKNAPPGAMVGKIRPRRTGRKKGK